MGEYVEVIKDVFEFAPDYLLRVGYSAHAIVGPDGTIYRCREDDQGAYHALGHNTDSLGIEIMVSGKHNIKSLTNAMKTKYITDNQYDALLYQCREWKKKHNITKIVRHSDISPGRKIDPGTGFPMAQFLSDLEAE